MASTRDYLRPGRDPDQPLHWTGRPPHWPVGTEGQSAEAGAQDNGGARSHQDRQADRACRISIYAARRCAKGGAILRAAAPNGCTAADSPRSYRPQVDNNISVVLT